MRQNSFKLITLIVCFVAACALIFYVSYKGPFLRKETQEVSSQAPFPEPEPEPEPSSYDETLVIQDGDTLASVLNRLGISASQAQEAIEALSKIFEPKDLKVDQEIYVVYEDAPDGEGYILKSLYFQPDIDHDIELTLTSTGSFDAVKHKKQLKHEYVNIAGNINISLYADALKAGASPKMLYDMIKAFSYDVDFQRDIQPNTEFSLFYDTFKDEASGLERPGELLYAKLVIEGKPYEIYRFQPTGGVPGYYTALGECVKKALLRTPIDGARLSSGFGNRKHPILGFTKMHKGVDFAAPKGTPIMAAGDGIVERCNPYGGYGNYICVRHNGNMKTAYAHLSRYAKGISTGKKVHQGQVIGYVGNTGSATGPHLHFELIQNGKHINPQKITQLPSSKLTGKLLIEFKAFMKKVEKMKKDREKQQMTVAHSGSSRLKGNTL